MSRFHKTQCKPSPPEGGGTDTLPVLWYNHDGGAASIHEYASRGCS